jgi:DNA modification methylase
VAYEIYQGDCLEVLRTLPDESIHCCVTSPPYWGLRDYGVDGQLGLEPTPDEYVAKMVEVFREVKRVLKPEGTLWLNLGDTYAANRGYQVPQTKDAGTKRDSKEFNHMSMNSGQIGLKPKDLVGIPWRVAFALQADGWWLRSDIIWKKGNPMPESVTDRPTKAHEYIFLLTKSERYYYDNEAIKEPVAKSTIGRGKVDFGGKKGREYIPQKGDPNYRGGNEQWGRTFDYTVSCVNGRNKRTVWTIATKPFSEAHFATFPPEIPETCIKAGTSERGCCSKCGSPWERVVERKRLKRNEFAPSDPRYRPNVYQGAYGDINGKGDAGYVETSTIGWQPTCTCGINETVPCTVLDPFAGAGTTLWVAEQLGVNSIGVELNPEYCEIIRHRMNNLGRLFSEEARS